MVSKVQRSPPGIHGIFDTRGTGELPNQFSELVRPGVELIDFYGAEVWSNEFATNLVATIGGTAELTVPQGESWYLKTLEGLLTEQAAITEAALSLEIRPPGVGGATVTYYTAVAPFTAVVQQVATFTPPQPMIFKGGSILLCRLRQLNGVANARIDVSASFYRF